MRVVVIVVYAFQRETKNLIIDDFAILVSIWFSESGDSKEFLELYAKNIKKLYGVTTK